MFLSFRPFRSSLCDVHGLLFFSQWSKNVKKAELLVVVALKSRFFWNFIFTLHARSGRSVQFFFKLLILAFEVNSLNYTFFFNFVTLCGFMMRVQKKWCANNHRCGDSMFELLYAYLLSDEWLRIANFIFFP